MAKLFFSAATFLTLAVLVALCLTGRVVLTAKAQAAPDAAAPATSAFAVPAVPAPGSEQPAPASQSGVLYVVDHGAWG